MAKKFNYSKIQGVAGNSFVTSEFIKSVEKLAKNLKTEPEYLLAAMSFETGGTFDPATQNKIGATGLIQFIKSTAEGLGTTTDELKQMSAVEQLEFVEKYFKPYKDKLDTLEAVYTTILSGSPKNADSVLFEKESAAYKLNPLDWNQDGKITAAEATTVVRARLFGGVKKVQQNLLKLGVVPLNIQEGFDDGRWGKNTSAALAEFQKSKDLPPTGLLDDETGQALFPEDKTDSADTLTELKKGDENDAVKKLHDKFVDLGYLDLEEIGDGYGIFGPLTQKAVKKFQDHFKLNKSGKFGANEQKLVNALIAGIAKNNSNAAVIRVIQDRLVVLEYMTQTQVNTGYGIFGNQTRRAVKNFQKDNLLQESGVVEKITFKTMFNGSDETDGESVSIAENGKYFDVKDNILMTAALRKKLEKLGKIYLDERKQKILVTSGYRPPERQASAMYNKIVRESENAVRQLYRNKIAVNEIINSYRSNKSSRTKAIEAMSDTIAKQAKRGTYISSHLRSNACDVRLSANLNALKKAVFKVGGRIVVERDHYHLELH